MTPPLILASNSPRRQQLLKDAGYLFDIQISNVEEIYSPTLPLKEVPVYLSQLKAKPLENIFENHVIIAADTVVILENQLIGKPKNLQDAIQMLKLLSDKKHTVISGVTFCYRKHYHSFSEKTDVYFKQLTDNEINQYVETAKPLDKAGAYGIQEWIGLIGVERIEGDFYNVMGLPVCKLRKELDWFLQQQS